MQELPDNISQGVARYTDTAVELAMAYGPKLLLAILTLFIGLWLIRIVQRGTQGPRTLSVQHLPDSGLHHRRGPEPALRGTDRIALRPDSPRGSGLHLRMERPGWEPRP